LHYDFIANRRHIDGIINDLRDKANKRFAATKIKQAICSGIVNGKYEYYLVDFENRPLKGKGMIIETVPCDKRFLSMRCSQ
jgi:hypothetical protein